MKREQARHVTQENTHNAEHDRTHLACCTDSSVTRIVTVYFDLYTQTLSSHTARDLKQFSFGIGHSLTHCVSHSHPVEKRTAAAELEQFHLPFAALHPPSLCMRTTHTPSVSFEGFFRVLLIYRPPIHDDNRMPSPCQNENTAENIHLVTCNGGSCCDL
jgi:hypothetical protein